MRNGNFTVSNSSITGNSTGQFGGGIYLYNDEAEVRIIDSEIFNNTTNKVGGGISIRSGTLSSTTNILRTTIADNTTAFDGGGIRIIGGRLNVVDSTVSGNSTRLAAVGGGIGAYRVDQMLVERSTISDNQAGSFGGGIFFDRSGISPGAGELTIRQSTLSNNRAAWGGALAITRKQRKTDIAAHATVTNSTISGNESFGDGGGIWVDGILHLAHSTISKNTSDINQINGGTGGGVFVSAGLFETDNSIIAGNFDNTGVAHDVAGIVNSTFSLIGFGAEFLGPLADNGGPTLTHALLPGSPAIDAGDPIAEAGVGDVPVYDQRGNNFGRVLNGRIDIGAYEVTSAPSADFDLSGSVNGFDFLAWQRGFGTPAPSAIPVDGDADNDNDVDGNDLSIWESQFGGLAPLVALSSVSTELSEPEPSAISLEQAALALSAPELTNAAQAWELAYEVSVEQEPLLENRSTAGAAAQDAFFAAGDIAPAPFVSDEIDLPAASSYELEEAEASWLSDELLERVFG